ncbi:MAG: hypothetical protein J4431_02295 [Candidatus Aenigmarchaeota archaeon]|nr:hypothetical protein [Candidatus Aenigmarchaeota archaeon]
MTLEDEMRSEIRRLENEIARIDKDMGKAVAKLEELQTSRKKKEKDLAILKASFGGAKQKELQTTLAGLV